MIEFVSVIALILGLLIGYIVVRRVAKPHSKRMGRNGAQPNAPTPGAPVGTGAPAVPGTEDPKGRFAWIAEYLWSILLVIAGLVIFFQGVYSSEWQSPSFALVASWNWNHWLQLLVLWGIGSALLALNKKGLGAAEPILQSTLMVVAVMAFLVCPVIGWIEGFGTNQNHQVTQPTAAVQTICPDVSAHETRSCLITNEWSNEIILADGPEANGKNFCGYPKMTFERRDENGTTYWKFKTNGSAIMKYRLFPAGGKCPNVL